MLICKAATEMRVVINFCPPQGKKKKVNLKLKLSLENVKRYPMTAAAETNSKCQARANSPLVKQRGAKRVLGKTAPSRVLGCTLHAENTGSGSSTCRLAPDRQTHFRQRALLRGARPEHRKPCQPRLLRSASRHPPGQGGRVPEPRGTQGFSDRLQPIAFKGSVQDLSSFWNCRPDHRAEELSHADSMRDGSQASALPAEGKGMPPAAS